MDYFLKANGLIMILWLFYYGFLRNETFFTSIRVYFLLGLLIIIFMPFIEIPIYVEKAAANFNWNLIQETTTSVTAINKGFDWQQILGLVYFSGVIFFGLKFTIQLFSLGKLLTKHKIIRQHNFKLVETDKNISPFSFFNYIIYHKSQFTAHELEQIINHEKTHVKQWHSADTLLTYILQIVFWFNPFAWLYKKEVAQNLEFLVDSCAFKSSKSQKSYQQLLLKTSIPNYQMALANNFYNSFLKKRIIMLQTKKSNGKSQWKFLLMIPLLMVFVFTLNTKTIAQKKGESTNVIVKTVEVHAMILTKNSSKDDLDKIRKSFAAKDLKVEFKGVKRNKNSEITAIKIDAKADNGKTSAAYAADDNEGINPVKIEYDNKNNSLSIGSSEEKHMNRYTFSKKGKRKTIKQKGKGKSYVFISDDDDNKEHTSTNVWVTKDGDTTKIKTKKVIIEIEEKDQGGEHEDVYEVIIDEDDEKNENKFLFRNSGGNEPLIIIDGKEFSKKEMDDLKPNDIESMNVIKGASAEALYGSKGKSGVIEIKTKNNKLYISNIHSKTIIKESPIVEAQAEFDNMNDKEPLFILNGKEISKKEMDNLKPDNIKSMNVLKGEKAKEKYGDKGKNGVIEITLKKD